MMICCVSAGKPYPDCSKFVMYAVLKQYRFKYFSFTLPYSATRVSVFHSMSQYAFPFFSKFLSEKDDPSLKNECVK